MTGVGLFVLFLFAITYLGARTLDSVPWLCLVIAGGIVCGEVGAHVERT